MLEEFDVSARHTKGMLPIAILAISKVLRLFGLYMGYSLLSTYDYSVILYTYYTLFFGSVILLSTQQPWKSRKQVKPEQWAQIGSFAGLLLVSLILFNFGLKYCSPLRTILSFDYADVTYSLMFGTLLAMTGKGTTPNKVKSFFALLIGYLILFWSDSPDYATTFQPRTFTFGLISLSESRMGAVALFLAVIVAVIKKQVFTKLATDMGGPKRTFALSVTAATAFLTPIAFIQYFSVESNISLSSFTTFITALVVATFSIAGEFYADTVAHSQLDPSFSIKIGLGVSVIGSIIFDLMWGFSSVSMVSFVAFGLVAYGAHVGLLKRAGGNDKELPLYGSGSHTRGINVFSWSFFKSSMQTILSQRDSRRIFLYLCINLMFMFVEALYGWLTNSLGLISDAAHMLFDSTALIIGLFASIAANWEPNKVYSFGYGRVEVVSGFINGIFLIFIAFAVLLESMERFFHPQEINTDKLLLVSSLGLLVNLIGVFAFHDLHGGGDHSGHSHSHGHSHGHGHGHGHEEEKEKKNHNSNLYGVYLHIIADTLGSIGVIISSLIISQFGYLQADPICSFCISLLIFVSVIPLLSNSAHTLLQCTPVDFEGKLKKCFDQLMSVEGVVSYRNPHFWQHYKDLIVGTIHVQIQPDASHQKVLTQVQKIFKKKGVKNLTVEVTKD